MKGWLADVAFAGRRSPSISAFEREASHYE
jgi:hypothetical protein